MHWRQLFLAIPISIILSLSACGQKGPLYLPGEDQESQQGTKK